MVQVFSTRLSSASNWTENGTRLKRYGINRATEGRNASLLALAARLPAPILAERIGIHQARAARWVRLAGASYADYVALRGPA